MSKTKTVLGVTGIIIVALIVSVVMNLYLYKHNIRIVSDVYIDDSQVIISREAYNQLDELYPSTLKLEIPACLAGAIKEDGLKIERIVYTKIIQQTDRNVTYVECPVYSGTDRIIGTIHNHPSGNCFLSSQDLETYASELYKGQAVIGLKCSKGFVFYILTYLPTVVEEY